MHDRSTREASQNAPNAGAVEPSEASREPYIDNPVGFDFVLGEIGQRNPIVRQALVRRAEGWTG